MVKAISPSSVERKKSKSIPNIVLEIVNEEITKNWNGTSARVTQEAILVALAPHIERKDVFANNYLDIEKTYRRRGWNVSYDKPGFNESYGAYFVFSKS